MKDFKFAVGLWFVAVFLPSLLVSLGFLAGLEEGKRSERRLRNAPTEVRCTCGPECNCWTGEDCGAACAFGGKK